MAVKVNIFKESITFDNANGWEFVQSSVGPFLNIFNSDTPSSLIATLAPGQWSYVTEVSKKDRSALLAEAAELIGDVDDGNYSHQKTDWQNRAEAFLAVVANK